MSVPEFFKIYYTYQNQFVLNHIPYATAWNCTLKINFWTVQRVDDTKVKISRHNKRETFIDQREKEKRKEKFDKWKYIFIAHKNDSTI